MLPYHQCRRQNSFWGIFGVFSQILPALLCLFLRNSANGRLLPCGSSFMGLIVHNLSFLGQGPFELICVHFILSEKVTNFYYLLPSFFPYFKSPASLLVFQHEKRLISSHPMQVAISHSLSSSSCFLNFDYLCSLLLLLPVLQISFWRCVCSSCLMQHSPKSISGWHPFRNLSRLGTSRDRHTQAGGLGS